MRIISGELKGRRIQPPANKWPTRPTTDFAKEGLYNILQNRLNFEELRVLDLFGGTGNHTFECLSRGSRDVTYVDKHPPCCHFVEETAKKWLVNERLLVRNMDVVSFLKLAQKPYDYVFAGPPYALALIDSLPDMILNAGLLNESGLLVLEHDPSHRFDQHPRLLEIRNYGKTIFSFFQ